MLAASAPMSLLGVQIAEWLEERNGRGADSTSAKVVGAALILGGLGFVAKTFVRRGVQPNNAPFILGRREHVIAVALGASGGFVVGLTSVGSGTFFALVMLLVFPLTAAKIVGTDIFHAPGFSGSPESAISFTETSTSERWAGCSSARFRECCSGAS
jgi:uncharacterized membrane protein YfcA